VATRAIRRYFSYVVPSATATTLADASLVAPSSLEAPSLEVGRPADPSSIGQDARCWGAHLNDPRARRSAHEHHRHP